MLRHCGVTALVRAMCTLTKYSTLVFNFPDGLNWVQKGTTRTYSHVVLALRTGGPPHAILCTWQKRQAVTALRRVFRFVDGNFNTPCPTLGLGSIVGARSDDDIGRLSTWLTLNVGIMVSEDEYDDDGSVVMRPPGEYE